MNIDKLWLCNCNGCGRLFKSKEQVRYCGEDGKSCAKEGEISEISQMAESEPVRRLCGKCRKIFEPPPSWRFSWCAACYSPAIEEVERAHLERAHQELKFLSDKQEISDSVPPLLLAAYEKERNKAEARERYREEERKRIEELEQKRAQEKIRKAKEIRDWEELYDVNSSGFLLQRYVHVAQQMLNAKGKDIKTLAVLCLRSRGLYLDALKAEASYVGKLNRLIWERMTSHDPEASPREQGIPTPHSISNSEDLDEEEDWRPEFLRKIHTFKDEDVVEEQGKYLLEIWVPFWRHFAESNHRLYEERNDEAEELWMQSDEEPKERPKITDAMLKTFHNIWNHPQQKRKVH